MNKRYQIKVDISIVLLLLFFPSVVLLQNLLYFMPRFEDRQICTLIISTIVYIFLAEIIIQKSGKINLFFVFLIISYFFNYGSYWVMYIFQDDSKKFPGTLNEASLYDNGYWMLYATIALCMGYCFITNPKCYAKNDVNKKLLYNWQRKELRKISILFLVFSFPAYVYNAIVNISITRQFGYGYRIIEGTSNTGLVGVLSGFAFPACTAYILARKEKEKLPFIILLFLYLLELFSGTRIRVFCHIIVLGYYFLKGKKISIKKIVIAVVLLYIVATVFSCISNNREALAEGTFVDKVATVIDYSLSHNVLISVLWETGYTARVSAAVLQFCPSQIPYIWGYSYFYSLIYVLPNFITNAFLPQIPFVDEAFAPFLTSYGGVGSSYSAEAFYNFGYFGLMMLVIIGVLWGKICKVNSQAVKENDILKTFFCFQIFQAIILMVRSDMVYRFRTIFWYVLPIIIIVKLLSRKMHIAYK